MAAAAIFSACETLEPQQPVLDSSAQPVVYTAKIGAETKTYLEWDEKIGQYKTLWSKEDQIVVYDYDSFSSDSPVYEVCNVTSGAGTSTAEFTGSLKADRYVALYGGDSHDYFQDGRLVVNLPRYQQQYIHYEDFWGNGAGNLRDNCYPMVAVSDSTDFEFKNICSILKLSISGHGERVDSIRVQANDQSLQMSGKMYVDIDTDRPFAIPSDSSKPYVTYFCWDNNYAEYEPMDYYVVLPAQTYTGGITVTIYTDEGWMEMSTDADLTFEPSQIRSVPQIEYVTECEWPWGLLGQMTDWGNDIYMTREGKYLVLKNQYLDETQSFKFRYNGDWETNLGGYYTNIVEINAVTELSQDGSDLYVEKSGYYDIYLDVDNQLLYLMEPGMTPEGSEGNEWM